VSKFSPKDQKGPANQAIQPTNLGPNFSDVMNGTRCGLLVENDTGVLAGVFIGLFRPRL